MRGILSIFAQYFCVQRIHHETRRKINLRSDELNGGPFSRRLIFCWIDIINSIYSLNSCWEIRIDPYFFLLTNGTVPDSDFTQCTDGEHSGPTTAYNEKEERLCQKKN